MAVPLFCGAVAADAATFGLPVFSFHGANDWQTNESLAEKQKEM